MMNGIGSASSMASARLDRVFSRLDTDTNGKVSRDEFVAGAPDDIDSSQAGSLFDALDSEGTGALSKSDMATAFEQLASTMQSTLIAAQGESQGHGPRGPGGGPPPKPEDMLAELDTDGDGLLSEAEFVAGRPDEVSEEQAAQLCQSIAGDDTDGLTAEQVAEGMGPPPPPPSGGQNGQGDDQLIDQLLAELEQAEQAGTGSGLSGSAMLKQFLAAVEAYQASMPSQTASTSVAA
jgi:Ca2+-binding EF-hand superfamily protein